MLEVRGRRPVFLLNVPSTWQTPAARATLSRRTPPAGPIPRQVLAARRPSRRRLVAGSCSTYDCGTGAEAEKWRRGRIRARRCRSGRGTRPTALSRSPAAIPLAILGGPLLETDGEFFDLVERCRRPRGARRHRGRPADVAPAVRSDAESRPTRSQSWPTPISTRFPTSFAGPTAGSTSGSAASWPPSRCAGIIFRRYRLVRSLARRVAAIETVEPRAGAGNRRRPRRHARAQPRAGANRGLLGNAQVNRSAPTNHLGRVGPSLRRAAARPDCASPTTAARCAGTSNDGDRATAEAADGQFGGRAAALELPALGGRSPAPLRGRGQEARRHDEGPRHRAGHGLLAGATSWPSIPTARGGCPACWKAAPSCWRSPIRWASTIRSARSGRCSARSSASNRFPIPGLLTCSVGATCDDFSAIAQRLESLGFPILWWEIPHRRQPEAGRSRPSSCPAAFGRRPGRSPSSDRNSIACDKRLETYAGQPLDDEQLADGIAPGQPGAPTAGRSAATCASPPIRARCRRWKC